MKIQFNMSKKTILTFVVIFFVYSTLGTILEHFLYFFSKDKKKAIANPILTGFPVYGIAAYLIIAVHKAVGHKLNIIFQFALYASLVTALEYVTGVIVDAGPNGINEDGYTRAWDYSDDPYNFQGKIKLKNFILFGILSLIITRIHPILHNRVSRMF